MGSPEETHGTPETILSRHTWETVAGTGEVIKMHGSLGQCACQSPGHPSCLDLGRAQNMCPTESVPLRSSWEPEPLRPGKCRKRRPAWDSAPAEHLGAWSRVDLGSTHHLELGQTQCGPYTASTPHTSQWYFVCSVPPSPEHKWTSEPKQVTAFAPFCQGRN